MRSSSELQRYCWTLSLVKTGAGERTRDDVHRRMRKPMDESSEALIKVASALDEASHRMFGLIREDRLAYNSVHQVHSDQRADRVADLVFFHRLRRRSIHDLVSQSCLAEHQLAVLACRGPAESRGLALRLSGGIELLVGPLPLTEGAAQTAVHNLRNADLNSRPIIFVAHSLGGLVVKQMARLRMTSSAPNRFINELLRGIVFLATPHTGAGLATAIDYARKFYRATPVVKALRRTIRIRRNSRNGSASFTTMSHE